jgi:hypothetical protein
MVLLLQAEKARDEAAARQAEAEQQLAAIEAALRKARALRALVGNEVIGQGETLLQETRAAAQAEVARLRSTAEATQAEVERLIADPAVRAYLDYREAQEQAEREAREQVRRGLEARLAALRPGAALGQGTESLEALAAEAEAHGFDETATRWLALLLQTDPTLPAPTAGAMVARVRALPLGADLAALDATLQRLGGCSLAELTTSERRVTAMLLADLLAQAHALLAAIP